MMSVTPEILDEIQEKLADNLDCHTDEKHWNRAIYAVSRFLWDWQRQLQAEQEKKR
jgi:hypothetical protein